MPPSFACPSTPQIYGVGQYKDYALNAGQGGNAAGDPVPYLGGAPISSCCPERALIANGIAHKQSNVKLSHVIDGTSNTFMILEMASVIPKFPYPVNPFVWTSHQSQGLAMSTTDKNGKYELKIGSAGGVVPGKYTVTCSDPAAMMGGKSSDDPNYAIVCKKYAQGTSKYVIDVQKSDSNLELKLD